MPPIEESVSSILICEPLIYLKVSYSDCVSHHHWHTINIHNTSDNERSTHPFVYLIHQCIMQRLHHQHLPFRYLWEYVE